MEESNMQQLSEKKKKRKKEGQAQTQIWDHTPREFTSPL